MAGEEETREGFSKGRRSDGSGARAGPKAGKQFRQGKSKLDRKQTPGAQKALMEELVNLSAQAEAVQDNKDDLQRLDADLERLETRNAELTAELEQVRTEATELETATVVAQTGNYEQLDAWTHPVIPWKRLALVGQAITGVAVIGVGIHYLGTNSMRRAMAGVVFSVSAGSLIRDLAGHYLKPAFPMLKQVFDFSIVSWCWSWLRPQYEQVKYIGWATVPEHSDARSDQNSLAKLKHADARYMNVRFTTGEEEREAMISAELLSQLTSQNVMTLNVTSDIIWDRICRVAQTEQATNVDRSLHFTGKYVVQDTCWAANIVYGDMRRRCRNHQRPHLPAS